MCTKHIRHIPLYVRNSVTTNSVDFWSHFIDLWHCGLWVNFECTGWCVHMWRLLLQVSGRTRGAAPTGRTEQTTAANTSTSRWGVCEMFQNTQPLYYCMYRYMYLVSPQSSMVEYKLLNQSSIPRWISLDDFVLLLQVVDIMRVNVDKVLERDQKLSELDDRAGIKPLMIDCVFLSLFEYSRSCSSVNSTS